MSTAAARAVLSAELIKIRTVRSTLWTPLLTFVISVGISLVFAMAFHDRFSAMPPDQQRSFDPVMAGFYGLTFGQLMLVAFGVLTVSSEYTTGMIRASLAAVPRRGAFYAAKTLAGTLVAAAVSVLTTVVTFFTAQSTLGPHGVSLGDPGVLRATLGTCLYMTLICAFSIGVATMLRSSVLSLGILIPLFFIVSPVLANIPALRAVAQYLPDQAGLQIMRVVPRTTDLGHDMGPLAGLLVLVGWTAASLLGGYLLLRRRDA
ncbi:ABC transporter permease subunit [Streptomyces sp. MST-110588]|uniref:ABC transporter permease subunit n=1 Tax=Streptomyces sp. MST-110588 TaxID=2833628 RepID=UPI001F5CBD3A|nr:ABC transporter permease subunit [Streptomyces sp. MST-110588]UNO43083.1 ABC transporter permease subunit [Streptomyces sp. MST-110588]